MITEDYVSFETAKILKEKGFDSVCENQYINFSSGHPFLTNICDNAGCYYKNSEIGNDEYSAPTLQMTMKWLREIHNLQIQIAPINSKYKDWAFGIYKDFSPVTIELICCPTYEEACETAIKYCLEHLI